jgi:hypothetical protein
MIFHIATLLFVVLKVFEHIDWSWWLVFAPSILGVTIAIVAVLVLAYAGMEKRR